MRVSAKLLLTLVAATAFSLAQPVKADPAPRGVPTGTVPDGGSTLILLGLGLVGVAIIRGKLSR
jgi:hypothetical protein